MKRLIASSSMAVLLAAGAGFAAAAPASAAPAASASHQAVNQSVTGTATNGDTFTGALSHVRVVTNNGVNTITGDLTGTVTDPAGNSLGSVSDAPVSLPILGGSGTCQVLHLDLGPLTLNLLGLNIHLNEVILDITAQSGPGNLVGNLLCGVAHLLDTNTSTGLGALINQLLAGL